MGICYRCQEPTFLKEYHEEIDGENRVVCGKCKDTVCACCGKTRRKDFITKWTHEKDPDTGELVTIGSCCTYVEGLVDNFKLYTEKYQNLQKNRPDIIEKMDQDAQQRRLQAQRVFGNKEVADTMINRYAARKKAAKNI